MSNWSFSIHAILILISAVLGFSAWAAEPRDVCIRTDAVRIAIEEALGKSCENIARADLVGVHKLNLAGKSIASLRVFDFQGLTALKTLELQANQIAVLPEGVFSDLNALETLNLDGNGLREISAKVLAGLSSVRNLSIGSAELMELPTDTFLKLKHLQNFYFAQCQLLEIPGNLFAGLNDLRRIDFHGCQIYHLPDAAFKDLTPEFLWLNLSSNKISVVSPNVFDSSVFPAGSGSVDLSDNPLTPETRKLLETQLGGRLLIEN